MANKEKLADLHVKILPEGADQVLTLLEEHTEQVELISFVIEKVPLLIIGRHGMIARIPQRKVMQKFSQPAEILNALRDFFQQPDTLYLFINLPNLPIPQFVSDLIDEVAAKVECADEIRRNIDDALDNRDIASFLKWSQALRELEAENPSSLNCGT